MNDLDCGFCKLISSLNVEREKLNIVYESDNVIAFHSTQPFAEIHIIIISKRHIPTIFDMSDRDNILKLELLKLLKSHHKRLLHLRVHVRLKCI